ncbi:MAG: type II CRISPR RNA-guided endonuclease Cas9 [Lachnospiraceae bacterium]|nr:type II CRISPR RNA-guided endonuclease Cas9 [Lachnospiraceae bacterium]
MSEYYLGLDMGTSSVGWCVTDPQYHLLRKKGKDLWGVRLFQEAQTSADRRVNRTNRRRRQREVARLGYVRDIFADAVNAVDPGFFLRLDESRFFEEDKSVKTRFSLFSGKDYTDKEYYDQYPTIFHLRKALIESTEPKDVRLVFLAVLNIFKHRGHFLNDNLDADGIGNLADIYAELISMTDRFPETVDLSRLEEILTSKKISNKERSEQLVHLFGIEKRSREAELIKLICGLKGILYKAFDGIDEEYKGFALSFREEWAPETIDLLNQLLSDEDRDLLMQLKKIHDWGQLNGIMQGQSYLSYARVASFEKHKHDLAILKKVYKAYGQGKYNGMFRIMAENNYSAYVGSVNSEKQKKIYEDHSSKIRRNAKARNGIFDTVKKDVQEMLLTHPEDDDLAYILSEIEKETFLPKQLTSANGVIPNQVHLAELKKILANAETYLPFLKDKDESNLTNSEKLIELFKFRIPYYVGPLYNDGKHNAWAVRKEAGAVLPWNFTEKIDEKASAEVFIQRMVRRCTYMSGKSVLPKNSLLYQKFMVLNELNNLKINGEPISVDLKQELFNGLFRTGKKVTGKALKKYLVIHGYVSGKDDVEITGIDGDFANTLSSYRRFTEILDVDVLTYPQEKMAEDIILWATVFGESRTFLKEKIRENYGDKLSEEQIKRISGIKFNDWGRLSSDFLNLEGADRETGEIKTLISRLWDENVNLMQCLSGRYTYTDSLKESTDGINRSFQTISFEDLDELYLSAPVKRMVWQTILVVREICSVMGHGPSRIFVEMARDQDDKNAKVRKDSRQKQLLALYKNISDEHRDWEKEIKGFSDSEFRRKKLYLYYTQMGRCMYTGEPIELQDLFNDNLYDIDHIYPRHFVKDDSIERNLVLVNKQKNAHKSDTFPIEQGIRTARMSFWQQLRDRHLISKDKFDRLTRSTAFTVDEQSAFINRQLVETRQGTKAVTQLFENSFPTAAVVYSKAGNVSDFRKKFDLLKCRELNNFHHANDAYLNIVVGNTYYTKFTKNPMVFVEEYRKNPKANSYHMDKLFERTVTRDGVTAWETEGNASINIVKSVMNRNTPLVTRMNFEQHGMLYKQNPIPARECKVNVHFPTKTSDERLADVTKYGGYTAVKVAYFFLVEVTEKGKRVRVIEDLPIYAAPGIHGKEDLEKYCRDVLGYVDPDVRLSKIKIQSTLKVNGFLGYITAKTQKSYAFSSGVELILDRDSADYIRKIYDYSDNQTVLGVSKDKNMVLYEKLLEKHSRGIYSKRPSSIGVIMKQGMELFQELSISEQIDVLKQILRISSYENQGVDLKYIGGSKNSGKSTIIKKISDKEEVKLINQSPAGLYREEIDLLTV